EERRRAGVADGVGSQRQNLQVGSRLHPGELSGPRGVDVVPREVENAHRGGEAAGERLAVDIAEDPTPECQDAEAAGRVEPAERIQGGPTDLRDVAVEAQPR